MAEGGRGALERRAQEPEHRHRLPLELNVAVDAGKAEEDEGEHGVTGRSRMVVEDLAARDEPLSVRGREVEAPALLVGEQSSGEPREPQRLLEVAQLSRR